MQNIDSDTTLRVQSPCSHWPMNSYTVRSFLFLVCFFLFLSMPTFARQAAIASAHPVATQAGESVLQQGGNAFDAAVAISAVLAVAEPFGSGLGGGGFFLLYDATTKITQMIDARETAPQAAHAKMYVDNPRDSLDGAKAAAIPGLPAGLVYLQKTHGTLPLKTLLAPAIEVARQGFWSNEPYIRRLRMREETIRRFASSRNIFLVNGLIPEPGMRIVQPDLAQTLEAIAEHGKAGFYEGDVANKLIDSVSKHGGIWTHEDLKSYQVKVRKPMVGRYRDFTIHTASLPSSGGIVLIQMLNMLERFDLQSMPHAKRMHVITEVMRRAYRDRADYLGDADFVSVPMTKLLSKSYAAGLLNNCRMDKATKSESLVPVRPAPQGSEDTTHFSVVDGAGNRVSATLSINYAFGSGLVAEGTGVLLNNEMDDFVSQPGRPNAYGLVGNRANAIEPGKRPLSSMTPTFVENEEGVLVLGTPGGSRIITMVLLGILAHEMGITPDKWLQTPRYHHQYLPDVIQLEKGTWPTQTLQHLKALGHGFDQMTRRYGNMQVIWQDKYGKLRAYSDPRGIGEARMITVK